MLVLYFVAANPRFQNAIDKLAVAFSDRLKNERRALHIGISGGRRILGLLTMSAATGDVLAEPRAVLDEAERARCTAVVDRLTDRQRDVLAAFAAGLNPQQVAEKLFISIKTVDSHKTVILAGRRIAWALPEDEWLDYRFLAEKFGDFVKSLPQTG
jgi:hypothetical protein